MQGLVKLRRCVNAVTKRDKIRDLVKYELDYYLENCNFTPEEELYFKLKAKDCSNIKIGDEMHIRESTVCNIAKRVKRKLKKVAFFK
jgi:DNA-binding NarL/FixJ family response regulator